MRLRAALKQPWDAGWLAERWPHIFTLINDDLGQIAVEDVGELVRLSYDTQTVDIIFDGQGLSLCVFRDRAELISV